MRFPTSRWSKDKVTVQCLRNTLAERFQSAAAVRTSFTGAQLSGLEFVL
jgi:hypothetical protein